MNKIVKIKKEHAVNVWHLMKDFPYDSLIDAAIHGYHGKIYADDETNPSICQITIAGTSYFFGDVNHPLAKDLVKNIGSWAEVITNQKWRELVIDVHDNHYKMTKRYSFTHEYINIDDLGPFIDALPKQYTYKVIDEALTSKD